METTLEAPPVSLNEGLKAAMQAEIAYSEAQSNPQQQQAPAPKTEAVQEQPPTQEDATSQEAQKTDQQKTGKKWEQLAKKEEAAAEEKTAEVEEEYPDTPPEAQNAWTKIKREVKELRNLRKQLEAEKGSWTAEKTEYETKLKEYNEKVSKFSDADLEALKKYREDEAIYNIERTESFQTRVSKPWNEGNSTLQEVSEYTNIPADKFKEALVEPNSLVRNSKVAKLLKTARLSGPEGEEMELDSAEIAALTSQVTAAGQKLHEATMANKELREEAATKGQQRSVQEEAAKIKAETEAKEVWNRASQEIESSIRVGLKDLVESGDIKEEHLKQGAGEQLSDDPMDRAYAIRASYLVPVMTEALRAARAKIAQLEQDRKDRMATRPGTRPSAPSGIPQERSMSLKDAMRAEQQFQGMSQ